jgi:hypothetical protein
MGSADLFAILSAVADVENAGIEVEISLMGIRPHRRHQHHTGCKEIAL